MKKISIFLCVLLLTLQSCTTVVYKNTMNGNEFANIEKGKSYTFYESGKPKYKAKVTEVDNDKVVAIANGNSVTINKQSLKAVKKNNPGGTTAIVVGSVAGMAAMVAIMVAIVDNNNTY